MRRTNRHPILSDKKLVIYDLKVERPMLPQGYEDDAWRRLNKAIDAIHHGSDITESLEVLYQLCEDLCQYDLAEQLFNRLRTECQRHIEDQFSKLSTDATEGVAYLEAVDSLWTSHCDQTVNSSCETKKKKVVNPSSHAKIVANPQHIPVSGSHICLSDNQDWIYMVRAHHASRRNMAMELLRANFMQNDNVRHKVIRNVLNLILSERNGENVDTMLLQSNLRMLIDLSLYHSEFEEQFLEESRRFYRAEGDKLVTELHMSGYLEHVSTRVHQESTLRVKRYFDKSSKAALTTIVEQELLTNRVEYILEKSLRYFMENYRADDLSLLYRLLRKVGCLEHCRRHFVNYIKWKGTCILSEHSAEKDTISALATFKRKTDFIVMHSFEENESFINGLEVGFDYFINLRQNNVIEILASHINRLLQSDKVALPAWSPLLNYWQVDEKALDQMLYKRDLAKRLLLEVMNRNAEKLMLAKIKKDCGLAYTSKLEGMLRDIKYSNDLMNEFKAIAYGNMSNLNFKVNVLTHGFWPSYLPIEITLPPEFVHVQDLYKNFYTTKFTGRRLTWQNSLGVCEVLGNFSNCTKDLTLTLLQTVVLLLFNEENKHSFTFSEIFKATNLDELELQRTLKSLACGTQKLLLKFPEGDDVQSTDQFVFNAEFTSDLPRVMMNTDTLNEVIESNTSINETVLIGRETQVDAAIVRIMKSKQTLGHSLLLSEVVRQVRFPVTAQDIKKRIELLIDKEYLARVGDDSYQYLS
ncbi:Cullin-4B [Apophysomyces ossiformis]|uniref:Cullin-4B n=1 Tax=Apophysomyces ossiformis TaxID=679940 RepID=A0A8H7ELH4_9FUNG|nr:Cullin-4B [Apophysomyces ossiformis]